MLNCIAKVNNTANKKDRKATIIEVIFHPEGRELDLQMPTFSNNW